MNEAIDFEWLNTENDFAYSLRWEDDGGQTCGSLVPEINKPELIREAKSVQILSIVFFNTN